jgi:hypothetical protein
LDLSWPGFSTYLPVELHHSQQIGDVLQALGRKESSVDDRYYV